MTRDRDDSMASCQTDDVLHELLGEIGEHLSRGEAVDVDDYLTTYPETAERLRRAIPGIKALIQLGHIEKVEPTAGLPMLGELGDYRIVREVGRGGMGVVYEAEQLSLHRRVALKVLPFAAVLEPQRLQRFKNEAIAMASLDHPNVVKVYGVGVERSIHFLAMQFIDGNTLADLIDARKRPKTPLPDAQSPEFAQPLATHRSTQAVAFATTQGLSRTDRKQHEQQIIRWAIQAAEALSHAPGLGIVHRDIKPSNLIIDSQAQLWVADFGLAQFSSDASLTTSGALLGTLRYMRPEQAVGTASVDHRTDIYSLGVSLYDTISSEGVFPGDDRQQILTSVIHQEPPSLTKVAPGVSTDLATIVDKMMSKSPTDRYASSDDLRKTCGGVSKATRFWPVDLPSGNELRSGASDTGQLSVRSSSRPLSCY